LITNSLGVEGRGERRGKRDGSPRSTDEGGEKGWINGGKTHFVNDTDANGQRSYTRGEKGPGGSTDLT